MIWMLSLPGASSVYLETPGLILVLTRVFMITVPPVMRLTTSHASWRLEMEKKYTAFLDLLILLGKNPAVLHIK